MGTHLVRKRIPVLVAMSLLCLARPGLANQPPGPMVSLPEIAILPLMVLLSLVGGAYTVRKRLGRKRIPYLWLGVVLVMFFSFTNEGLGWMTAMVFAVIAVYRGVCMVVWGMQAKSSGHEHLSGIRPARLTLAGGTLILIASVLATTATAFVGYWPMESFSIEAVERFAAHQLAYAEEQSQEPGRPKYHELVRGDNDWVLSLGRLRRGTYKFELGEDGESFTLFVLPQETFPFYPFNLLTSQPSMRVDETGAIRMIRVQEPDIYCPADAPMVLRVYASDPSRPDR